MAPYGAKIRYISADGQNSEKYNVFLRYIHSGDAKRGVWHAPFMVQFPFATPHQSIIASAMTAAACIILSISMYSFG